MIVLDCEQGTPAWLAARAGIPTASNFDKIVTPGGKLSASRDKYLHELLVEWALGPQENEWGGDYWITRGRDLEPEARRYYALQRDMEPRQVGFIYRDEARLVGCSPDWICPPSGMAEVKCPKPSTHMGYLLEGGAQYTCQVQGQLWVTRLEWSDFVSYCPGLPPLVVRCLPDPKMQDAFSTHLPAFCDELQEARARLLAMGVTPFVVTPERQTEMDSEAAARLSAAFQEMDE